MKILVLSDSHSNFININDKYNYIIHCGDYGKSLDLLNQNNCIYVRGNCDTVGPKHLVRELFNRRVFITHGDLENVKFNYMSLVYKALEVNAHICFFGHTHYQEIFENNGILFINPGSYPDSYVIIDDNMIKLINKGIIKKVDIKW